MIGKTISHYKILGKLGEGGMGVVYHAEDLTLKRNVALKFLPVHALDDKEQQTRLVREAQAAAALEHININTVYEIDEVDGQTFIAMAYVRGQTLKEKIKEGPLSVETALSLGIQIASGLNKAHAQGIVHRDIKPANVLVTSDGIIKIVDFGLAKLAGATGLTKTDSTIGTAAYMSPEQALGQVVDHRTDIWSLGVILYEMLAGHKPFRGEHEAVMVYSILNEDYEPLNSSRDDIPEPVERIITKALIKKPAERYQTVAEMLLDLRELLGETPADVTGPMSSRSRRVAVPPKRSRTPLMAGGAVVVLAAIIAGFMFFRSPSPPAGDSMLEINEQPGLAGESLLTAFDVDSMPPQVSLAGTAAMFADSALADSTADSLRIPTVAVLYLENLSGDARDDYFAAGMTEDIISDLSCIHALRVLSADEVTEYRDRSMGILKIGQTLGADYLMNASVRRAKDELHVIAQLLKVDDGTLVWNQRFDQAPQDIFAVRTEVASAIALAMDLEIVPSERESLSRIPTRDMEAYDSYLQGRMLHRRHTESGNKDAEKELRKALKRDPDFAPAMAKLAAVYLERIERDWDIDPKWMTEVAELLNRARTIDPASAGLHQTLVTKYRLSGEYDQALLSAQRLVEIHSYDPLSHYLLGVASYLNAQSAAARQALDSALVLNPDYADAYLSLNQIAHEAGRTTEAGRHLAKALELEPKAAGIQAFAGAYALTRGKFDEAVTHFETANRLMPATPSLTGQLGIAKLFAGSTDDAISLLKDAAVKSKQPQFYWYLGWAYRLQDDEKDAKRAFGKGVATDEVLLAINPRNVEASFRLSWAKYLAGDLNNLQAEVDRLETLSLATTNPSSEPYFLAGIYATIGDQQRAMELLRQVQKLNYYSSAFMAADPTLMPLRKDAEFRKLVGLDDQS